MSEHVFDRQRWAELDIFNQLGNIGSEVGRALAAKRAGKESRMLTAMYRGVDLINATIDDWQVTKKGSLRELLCARDLFIQSVLTDQEDLKIEKYFMEFAMAARLRREL